MRDFLLCKKVGLARLTSHSASEKKTYEKWGSNPRILRYCKTQSLECSALDHYRCYNLGHSRTSYRATAKFTIYNLVSQRFCIKQTVLKHWPQFHRWYKQGMMTSLSLAPLPPQLSVEIILGTWSRKPSVSFCLLVKRLCGRELFARETNFLKTQDVIMDAWDNYS